jgi:LytS/YehU family sensor histidine kinase
MEAQYELLKSQVQPHFLFNSLNSLISLVDEDSRRAKKFIKELSFVYRYLLQSNMHTLVTIKEEMAFISAYQFLLQTRFEEGLKVLIDIEDNVQNKLLPPLTVQILLENAVKHNRAEKDHPLCVDIKARGDLLLVQNNIQRKPEPVYSSKLGLSNIIAKYASLRQQDNILVEERDSVFSVSLPLIPEASAAATAGKLQKEPL